MAQPYYAEPTDRDGLIAITIIDRTDDVLRWEITEVDGDFAPWTVEEIVSDAIDRDVNYSSQEEALLEGVGSAEGEAPEGYLGPRQGWAQIAAVGDVVWLENFRLYGGPDRNGWDC